MALILQAASEFPRDFIEERRDFSGGPSRPAAPRRRPCLRASSPEVSVDGKTSALLFSTLLFTTSVSAEPPALQEMAPRALLGVVFDRALQRAAEKLGAPACRLVLTDFRDASGRSLDEKLADTGLSAPEFLTRLEFRDGRNES